VAKYGSNSLIDEFDNASDALQVMTQFTLEVNGIEIEAVLEESHSFGDSWFESLATGMRKLADIVKSGFYDDTATTGPDVIYNAVFSSPATATRTQKFTYGSTKTSSVETLIFKYGRKLARARLHMYEVSLRPSGAVTEA
jgi:hypothetical protein